MLELNVEYENVNQLYRAYMPFVNYGGIFIATNADATLGETVKVTLLLPDDLEVSEFEAIVVWRNPVGVQGGRPIGLGVQLPLPPNNVSIKTIIETSLNRKLNGIEMTSTM